MEGGRVRPSHGQGRYGVVPSKAPDIVAISVLLIRLPHHTIGGRHRRSFPRNAANIEERVMITADASQVGAFSHGKGHFDLIIGERRVHLLQPLVLDEMEATETADESSPCGCFECVVVLNLCSLRLAWWSANSLHDRPQ